ncbi:hypothetical protein MTBBW1_1780004 [Desulfamplus magnetovallimortis]|uniref:Uncharacterized protein n=2 Tax=Desulfamplus magnetovallimortis TaxID=1246637 RepID=A0A1W1HAA7_9BACT|nr:hypothetical protein MTBBW1_1780004 [Desulfamplus magnetovallimortis]
MNIGEIEGKAYINNNANTLQFDGEENCSLTFQLNGNALQVSATDGCSYYGGLNVTFEGRFIRP